MDREIDLNELSKEQLKKLEEKLSEELIKINDTACAEANKLLSRVKLKAVMQFKIVSEQEYEEIQKEKQETKD